jgi:hypothetical protein
MNAIKSTGAVRVGTVYLSAEKNRELVNALRVIVLGQNTSTFTSQYNRTNESDGD